MADITNRSRFEVAVKNRPDLTRLFSFNQLDKVEAYMGELRQQRLKPKVKQLDESWLVRIREKGHKEVNATFKTQAEAEVFIGEMAKDRGRSLFTDYSLSRKVTLAELMVRYLLEEAPRQKSHKVIAYTLEGWLADSGSAGAKLLDKYREELRQRKQAVRPAKFQMRKSSNELAWIHKPLADITTVDVETFIRERLDTVAAGTVDREIDRLKAIFQVATSVWDYSLAKNPMSTVRRPKYFNERDRRISGDEERRLLDALAQLDYERAVEERLAHLARETMAGRTFTSDSARKKVLAQVRAELRPVAEETAEIQPYLQVFYRFQVMTAARRGETMTLPWKHVDFDGGTAFLPETKNGRARKLSLRQGLVDLLRQLPRTSDTVFAVTLDYLVGGWTKACAMAGIEDPHIHDLRHEAISRVAETGKFTLPELQTFSGHRDLRMLMRYAHLCASRLAKKLDECFKDETKVRIHRGRKLLNKTAGIRAAHLTEDVDAAIETGAERARAECPAPKPPLRAEEPAAPVSPAEPLDAATLGTGGTEAAATVIAFPVSRIVRKVESAQSPDNHETSGTARAG